MYYRTSGFHLYTIIDLKAESEAMLSSQIIIFVPNLHISFCASDFEWKAFRNGLKAGLTQIYKNCDSRKFSTSVGVQILIFWLIYHSFISSSWKKTYSGFPTARNHMCANFWCRLTCTYNKILSLLAVPKSSQFLRPPSKGRVWAKHMYSSIYPYIQYFSIPQRIWTSYKNFHQHVEYSQTKTYSCGKLLPSVEQRESLRSYFWTRWRSFLAALALKREEKSRFLYFSLLVWVCWVFFLLISFS